MATIDDKVVAMSFESSKFESGVDKTISSLDKLKSNLKFPDAGKGLDDLNAAANRVDLSHIAAGVDTVKDRLHAFSLIAVGVFANLASNAVGAGANIVKSFSLAPVLQGFDEYATNLNAIQTVLANTAAQGTTLNDVNGALAQLNTYSDKTIYNFGEMARNIGTFTAAGVELKPAVESIKGIANLAALSGSNSQQASTAMYQLSQAIAAGSVKLQDWNSVVNAGMGGAVFQKALFDTGKAMGTITSSPVGQTFEEWKKAGNSFRQSLSDTTSGAVDSTKAIAQATKDGAKSVKDAQQSAADAAVASAKTVKDAETGVAETAKSSAETVKNAQKGVADAHKQAAIDIQAATQAQRDTIKQSAADVKSALDSVREARKQLAEAMKPPSTDELQAATDNLKTAQLDQQDLATAVTDAQTEQKRSAEDLAAAQQKLADLQATGTATPDQIMAAQRAVEDGQKRVTDAADAQERALLQQNAATRGVDQATKDLQTTKDKGTAKDAAVKTAQDAVTAAIQQYKDTQIKADKAISDAEKNVADVRTKSVENQKAAGQKLVDARKQQTKDIAAAGQRLADAEQAQAKSAEDSQQRIADAHEQAAKAIDAARNSIAKKPPMGWLTSDVLTKTLSQFTGDVSDAKLKAQGFSDAQIKAIQAQAKAAGDAATKVKTLKQVMDVAKETMGSGWAQSFQLIFGNFGEAKKTFTDLSNAVNGIINKSAKARNAILKDWRKLGGRQVLIEGLKSAFTALGEIMKPIKEAFRDFFPATTGKSLLEATKRFKAFADAMHPSAETVNNLKRTFKGLFAILDIGKVVVKDIFGIFGKLFGSMGVGSGGFLDITAKIGDFIVKVDKAVKSGGLLKGLFVVLDGVLNSPIHLLNVLTGLIAKLFGGFDTKGAGDMKNALGQVGDTLTPLQTIMQKIEAAWKRLKDSLGNAGKTLQPIVDNIAKTFGQIGKAIGDAFDNLSWDSILKTIGVGLLGGIVLLLKNFLNKGVLGNLIGKGLTGSITGVLGGLTNQMKTMQQSVKAKTIMEIAIAIGILAGSIFVLSTIDPKKLNSALSGMAIAFGELLGAMAILDKISSNKGFIKLPIIAGSMILLAIAIDLLVIAVKAMSGLSWSELLKGLGGVAVLLGSISLAAKPLSDNSAGLIAAGTAMILIGVAMKILASAVKDFGGMDLTTLGKGLGSVAIALVAIASASKLFPPGMPFIGAGLVLIGAGLKILASAVKDFGTMDFKVIRKGLISMGIALAGIALAMDLMPPSMPLLAAGLVLVASALIGISGAMKLIGSMSGEDVIKSMLGLGGALAILTAALYAMSGTVEGSAALTLAAVALDLLAPALVLMGKQSWETILKGLIGLGGALLILGGAGALLAPVAPALLSLGVALLAIGGGLALAGAGIALISIGISSLVVSGPAGIAILIAALLKFIDTIPKMVTGLVNGLLSMVKALADTAPQFVDALIKIATSLLNGIITLTPKLVTAFEVLLSSALRVLTDKGPDIIAAGITLLETLLKGIADNIFQVTTMVGTIVTNFINALTVKLPEIISAGANFLVKMLEGIASNMGKIAQAGLDVVLKFLTGLTDKDKLLKVVEAAANVVIQVVNGIANKAGELVGAGLNVVTHILTGIGNKVGDVLHAAEQLAKKFINAFVKEVVNLADDVATGIIDLLNGLASVIRDREWEVIDAMFNIGKSLVEGLVVGLEKNVKLVYDWLKGLVSKIVDSITNPLGIWSPSRVFMGIGENLMLGLAGGIEDNTDKPLAAMGKVSTAMADAIPDEVKEPEITPVLNLDNIRSGVVEMNKIITGTPSPEVLKAALAVSSTGTIQQGMQAATDIAAMRNKIGTSGGGSGSMGMGLSPLNFTQNNYSPESLSEVEIYRQTKNQISIIQRAVDDPTLQMR